MNIKSIQIYKSKQPNPHFNQSNMIVLVETDSGLVGIGEGGTKDSLEQCAGMLIGEDPSRIQHLWQLMYRGYFYPAGREKLHALGALDLALWDLKGKLLGVPVYELLGGLTRNYIECYSTGFPWQGSFSKTAQECIKAGFYAYRTSVADGVNGVFDSRRIVKQTEKQCNEIANAVQGIGDWSIDFHTRLDMADAVRLANLITNLEPIFIEDPLRSENASGLGVFRSQVRVPIAVGEQFGDRWDIHELIEKQWIDYGRITLPNTGGITEFLKIAALCETHSIGLIPHFTGPIALAALIQVLSALSLPVMIEVTGTGPSKPLHLKQGVNFHDGKLWSQPIPGLGVDFDPSQAELVSIITEHFAPIPLFRRPDGSYTNW
jgi:galactonate dehydratase